MSEINQFSQDYKALQQLENHMKPLGFQTALHRASSEVPIPMMTMALDQDEQGEVLILSLGFTPYMEEIFEQTRFLQLSIQLNLEVTDQNRAALMEFSNLVNCIIPVGHFTILDDRICYRYTCPLSWQTPITDKSCLETISFHSLLAVNHNGLFAKLAAGVLTLEEAERKFYEDLKA